MDEDAFVEGQVAMQNECAASLMAHAYAAQSILWHKLPLLAGL